MLQRCEGGVDAALQYAKNISKYMKDLIGYLEKRTALGEMWRGGSVHCGVALGWGDDPESTAWGQGSQSCWGSLKFLTRI